MSCSKCGCDIAKPVTIVFEGVPVPMETVEGVANGSMCFACLDECYDELAVLREQFEALLASGYSSEAANVIMISQMEAARAEKGRNELAFQASRKPGNGDD